MNSEIHIGDCRKVLQGLPDESVRCCVTSPPYWGLRDYGVAGQIGMEGTVDEFITQLVDVFREVRRVLTNDGTCWVNMGDCYAGGGNGGGMPGADKNKAAREGERRRPEGFKNKDMIGQPWMLAFALRADGWFLRSDIIWHKPTAMPESVKDRPTKAHEYVFLLSKSERYFYDFEAIMEPKDLVERRNKRSVWSIASTGYSEAHFATFPPDLVKPCVLAGSEPGDLVLDPFAGSGTTGEVAVELGRKAVLIELNPEYGKLIEQRLGNVTPGLGF
ncbi:UNVERIFIED_CONTAM: hypothetical protein GTU68_059582 [Idotea baltica]|nr:hypothetical protein [Idotea baltica]